MKTKIVLLFTVLSIAFCSIATAQSLFKPLPRAAYSKKYSLNRKAIIADTLPSTGTSFTGFRFTGPSVLYAFPNSSIFTGLGVSYENDTYNTSTGKWYTNWSIAAAGYAGGQFAPQNVSGVTALGLSVSLFNKLLTVGVLYNLTNKKFQGAVGPTVSLNN
jgi:hypothetical protein